MLYHKETAKINKNDTKRTLHIFNHDRSFSWQKRQTKHRQKVVYYCREKSCIVVGKKFGFSQLNTF